MTHVENFFAPKLQCFLSFSIFKHNPDRTNNLLTINGNKQIYLLLLNNFYPVIPYRRDSKKKATNYRLGHSLRSANQLPARVVKRVRKNSVRETLTPYKFPADGRREKSNGRSIRPTVIMPFRRIVSTRTELPRFESAADGMGFL